MELKELGYNSFFETNRTRLGLGDLPVARVIAEHKGAYTVKDTDGEYLARITGKRMFNASSREDYPAVGDWVVIAVVDDDHAVIHSVLPRRTILKRKYGDKDRSGEKDKTQVIATNVDIAFVVESVDRDYNLNRFERYFAIARQGGVRPAIILNKIDLISKEELAEKLTQIGKRLPDIDVIPTSIANEEGLGELKSYMVKGRTHCFLGSSGVGKSSLINVLLGSTLAGGIIRTGDISSYSERGKHITTSRQMYLLKNGGIVIDNPGIREVGVAEMSEGIENSFDEIAALAKGCKYIDCTHAHERGCEVLAAVRSGELNEEKYAHYIRLKKEADFHEMNDNGRREKDRQFGKFIKKAKKDLKDIGRKDR